MDHVIFDNCNQFSFNYIDLAGGLLSIWLQEQTPHTKNFAVRLPWSLMIAQNRFKM